MTDLRDEVSTAGEVGDRVAPERSAQGRRQLSADRGRAPGLAAPIAVALAERRFIVLLPFTMIAGLIVSLQTPSAPDSWALAAVGAATVLAMALLRGAQTGLRLATLFSAFWLGFSLLVIHGALFGTDMLGRPAYGTYQMRVDQVLSEPESGTRAYVSAITPVGDARPLPIRRARLVIDKLSVAPGDVIESAVRFYPVPGPVVPNGFDTQFHMYFAGVGAYGNTLGTPTRLATGDASGLDRVIDSIRRGIAARIDAALPEPSAGIARALITGDQSEVMDAVRTTMATAGIAHVLSVSGLHLSLVALGTYGLLRLLLALSTTAVGRLPVKRLAAVGGMATAVAYFAISGGSVAAVRSTIMILLVLGAVVLGRRALTMRNVALAALIVVVTDPAGVFRPSFQLSFAAVVGLIGGWELISRRPRADGPPRPAVVRYLGGIVVTSLIAGAATLLFTIYHFQQTSPLGVIGNLAALPLVGFVIMPSALAATLLMPFGLETPVLRLMGWAIDRMLDIAGLVTTMSAGFNAAPLLTPLALVLALGAFAWFAFLSGWQRLIGPAALVPAVILFCLDGPPDMLVSDSTQAIAVRGPDGLELIAGKAKTFAVGVWSETYRLPIVPNPSVLSCDSIGCFGRSPAGFNVAVVKDPAAFFEDCADADVVVARIPAPTSCHAPAVIDAAELERGGVQWLRWNPTAGRFDVRTAISPNDRPWRIQP